MVLSANEGVDQDCTRDGSPRFKLCIGRKYEFMAICKAMLESGILPDFITIDGAEGGHRSRVRGIQQVGSRQSRRIFETQVPHSDPVVLITCVVVCVGQAIDDSLSDADLSPSPTPC